MRTRVSGDVDGRELTDHVAAFMERDDLPVPFRELYDAREVGRFSLDSHGVRGIVEMVRRRAQFSGARFAVVTDRDMIYGMARLTSLVSEAIGADYEFRAFRDINEAEVWLLSEPEV